MGILQGIFLTQGTNLRLLCLLQWQAGILLLSHQESPFHHLLLQSVVQHWEQAGLFPLGSCLCWMILLALLLKVGGQTRPDHQ